ncbi:hypothetical protein LTR53_016555 [Teratosphaeriaceae sp. CCFEE 6253]|nr:hypothetical protein LTR53_016555 [Teratosphaeriaceae sp. CCFEE 6253]
MRLRVSEEVEMMGLDLDQFFDEQIGESDWDMFTSTGHLTHGVPGRARSGEGTISSDASMEREAVRTESKEV